MFQDYKQSYEYFSEVHNDIISIIEDVDFDAEDAIRKDTDKFYYETVILYHLNLVLNFLKFQFLFFKVILSLGQHFSICLKN